MPSASSTRPETLRRRVGRLLRALPLDWRAPGRAPQDAEPDPPPGPIDVIVPVYGAAEDVDRCLASLERHTDLGRHRLVVVVDGGGHGFSGTPAERRLAALEAAPGRRVLVLRSPERRGFVGSANRGMAASDRDVVLLNSDTVVTAGWLDKLQEAAYSHPAIATVTPFSNDATICSLPRWLEHNALPAGWDLDAFAALVERVSARERTRLPTGIGVCLYIKRKVLARLGLLDEASFGLGYGEESELSMRALKAGYVHALDDATFILHAGRASFGRSRAARVRAAHRAMARLHPEYLPTVGRFIAEDPLAAARERVMAALRPARVPAPVAGGPARVLHVVHGWPPWNQAGTEVYARSLATRQAAWREVAVWARIADPGRDLGDATELVDAGARVRLAVNNFTQRDPLSRNAIRDRRLTAGLRRLLDEVRPDLVHVHHLAGHAAAVLAEVERRGIPILYQVQDWWTPCARANLLDAERRLCPGPSPGRCAACLPLTGLPPAPLLNRLLYLERQRTTRRALRRADAWIVGSRFIRDSYEALGLFRPGDDVRVLPYGVELGARAPREPRPAGAPLRFGVIGSMLPHKGMHVAVAAFRHVDPARATLTLWGDPGASPAYVAELAALAGEAVRFAGRFPEAEKAAVLAGLDVLVVPSLGLESFGIVAREALWHGVPVVASRRGALTELFEAGDLDGRPAGALFDPDDPGELARLVERLIAEPRLLDEWRAAIPAAIRSVKGMDEHAVEIERVYADLLARRRGGGSG